MEDAVGQCQLVDVLGITALEAEERSAETGDLAVLHAELTDTTWLTLVDKITRAVVNNLQIFEGNETMGSLDVDHLLELEGRSIATWHAEEGDSHTVGDIDVGSTAIIG